MEGNPGKAVNGPETVEKLLSLDWYWDMMDFSGKREGLYLSRTSDDGTQAKEYTTDSVMIYGHNCLNRRKDMDFHGMCCQSTSTYMPQVIVPLTESKVSLHEAYRDAVEQWDKPDLTIEADGRPALKHVGFCVSDDSATSKKDKLTGTSSDNFCPFCTQDRASYRAGCSSHLPNYENTKIDPKTFHLAAIRGGDGAIISLEAQEKAVRYPIKQRVH